jgi:sugar/nucleoside kinase (ribokinase family)
MTDVSIIGNINADVIARPVDSLPPPGTERTIESIELRVGGAAAITALCLAALGVSPKLVGSVGDDPVGKLLLDQLVAGGVPVEGVAVTPGTTSICIATETKHQDRSFLIAPGSHQAFSIDQVPDGALSARCVLMCGYFLMPALRSGVTAILREVKARGGETFLDTGWAPSGWSPETKGEVLGLLPGVDAFLPNELEATAIADEQDPSAAGWVLQAGSGGWCIIKRGSDGSLALGPGRCEFAVAAPAVDALDTTGAGDAFNAGVLWARMNRRPWEEAVSFATQLASTVVSRPSDDRYPGWDDLRPRQ